MEVEDDISIAVLPWYCVGPQFLHKEDLVCEVGRRALKVINRCSTHSLLPKLKAMKGEKYIENM